MNRIALKIAIIYVFGGMAWILGSDSLVLIMGSSIAVEQVIFFESIKGFAFILFTGTLLYYMVKKSYLRLQESELWYRKLFNESPIPKLVYEIETLKIIDANKAACRQYGYQQEEFSHLSLEKLFPKKESDSQEWMKNLQKINSHPVLALHLKKDGTRFFTKSHPSVQVHKGSSARLVDVLDVHDKVLAEKKNREADKEIKKLSLVAEKTQNSVIITGKTGCIEWVNEGFVRQTGYKQEEVVGKKPGSFLQGPRSDKKAIQQIKIGLKKKEKFKAELINYRKDKTIYWVRMFISPIFNEAGELIQYIAIETDITEHVQITEKLEWQNAQLKQIAWISSHEIRRPVASILGLMNLFDHQHPEDPFNKTILQHLNTSTKELDEVIYKIVNKTYEVDSQEASSIKKLRRPDEENDFGKGCAVGYKF